MLFQIGFGNGNNMKEIFEESDSFEMAFRGGGIVVVM